MNMIVSFLVGFCASKMFFDITHKNDFPEVGRYGLGIIAIYIAMTLCGIDKDERDRFLLLAGALGAGVALARVTQQ